MSGIGRWMLGFVGFRSLCTSLLLCVLVGCQTAQMFNPSSSHRSAETTILPDGTVNEKTVESTTRGGSYIGPPLKDASIPATRADAKGAASGGGKLEGQSPARDDKMWIFYVGAVAVAVLGVIAWKAGSGNTAILLWVVALGLGGFGRFLQVYPGATVGCIVAVIAYLVWRDRQARQAEEDRAIQARGMEIFRRRSPSAASAAFKAIEDASDRDGLKTEYKLRTTRLKERLHL